MSSALAIPIVSKSTPEPQAQAETLMVDAVGLAIMLGVSLRHVNRLDVSGRVPLPRKLGRLKRWPIAEIKAWVEAGCPARGAWEAMRRQKK